MSDLAAQVSSRAWACSLAISSHIQNGDSTAISGRPANLRMLQRGGPLQKCFSVSNQTTYGFKGPLAVLSPFCIQLDIAGDQVHALLDTGAARSLMAEK